jgi:imidazolonepropionase-like amidohydrolase
MLDEHYPAMYVEEMEYYVRLGMSRLEAITAATKHGAIVLGREADLGTIEQGKLADLQVLEDDPLRSFESLGRPRLVMIGGAVHRDARVGSPAVAKSRKR